MVDVNGDVDLERERESENRCDAERLEEITIHQKMTKTTTNHRKIVNTYRTLSSIDDFDQNTQTNEYSQLVVECVSSD